MSLAFSHDPVSKREKQEIFKKSLDDQRRMNQAAATSPCEHSSTSLDSRNGQDPNGINRRVPGLEGTGGPGLSGLEYHHHHHQQGASTPRFEGSASPRQQKQPYMSALSEMNGRSPQVRQQQFEKEGHYRRMLQEQIDENKKRKEGEKAKLEEEKRKELEEIQRLQGRPPPRRQQHAQFQESPDLPLPSPGRLPPSRHPKPNQQKTQSSKALRNYDREIAPAHGALTQYGSRNHPAGGGSVGDAGGRWQGRQTVSGDTRWDYEGLAIDREQNWSSAAQSQERMAPALKDFAAGRVQPEKAIDNRAYCRNDEYSQGRRGGEVERPNDEHSAKTAQQPLGGEGHTARKLSFGRGGRELGGPGDDVVPRADFDELSNLCRDLLLEQKDLRRKLEEREEKERLADKNARESELQQQQRSAYAHGGRQPRRAALGSKASDAAVSNRKGDGRRRSPQLSTGSASSRVQNNNSGRESTLRHVSKAKSSVAFGSSVPRMEQPRKVDSRDRPRGSAPGSNLVQRSGGRDPRVSKSEPVLRSDDAARRLKRNDIPSSNHYKCTDSVGKPFDGNPELSEPADWIPNRINNNKNNPGAYRFEKGDHGGGNGTMYGQGSAINTGSRFSSTDNRGSQGGTRRGGDGCGELGGESMFLATGPHGSGVVAESGLQGRDGRFLDPRAATDQWSTRR